MLHIKYLYNIDYSMSKILNIYIIMNMILLYILIIYYNIYIYTIIYNIYNIKVIKLQLNDLNYIY